MYAQIWSNMLSLPLGMIPSTAALVGLPSTDALAAPSGLSMETGMMELGDLLPTGGLGSKIPAAGAYVGDGMPPIPAKIRRWEFVEMGDLLPEFWVGPPKEAEGESAKG